MSSAGHLQGKDVFSRKYKSEPQMNLAMTQQVQQEERFIRYNNWLQDNGAIYPSVNYNQVEFPVAFGDHGLVGAMAREDIPSSKAFIFVPYKITITPNKAYSSDIGFIFDRNPYWFKGDARELDNTLYVFLMHERLRGPLSFWYAYFEVIPDIETIIDWTPEQIQELHDPYIIYDAKKVSDEIEGLWTGIKQVLDKYPDYFPPEQDIRGLFYWAYKLVTTRSFAWDDGMIIPLADNFNHIDVYISYETRSGSFLDKYCRTGSLEHDYGDFKNTPFSNKTTMIQRTYRNRLQKFLVENEDISKLQSVNYIWDIDDELEDYQSSTDNEELREDYLTEDEEVGPAESEEEEDEEDKEEEEDKIEPLKSPPPKLVSTPSDTTASEAQVPQDPVLAEKYFMLTTGRSCSFQKETQIYNCYGRVNNHDLLIDYGFAMQYNCYDSFLFRVILTQLWKNDTNLTGIITVDDIINKRYKLDPSQHLTDTTEQFILKVNKLNTNVLTHLRATTPTPQLDPELQGNSNLPEVTKQNIIKELNVLERALALYNELNLRFLTNKQEDKALLQQDIGPRLFMAISKAYADYRTSQRRILANQIKFVIRLQAILQRILEEEQFMKAHLPDFALEEIIKTYPLRNYLKQIRFDNLDQIQQELIYNILYINWKQGNNQQADHSMYNEIHYLKQYFYHLKQKYRLCLQNFQDLQEILYFKIQYSNEYIQIY